MGQNTQIKSNQNVDQNNMTAHEQLNQNEAN